ncbi:hypothetical protein Golax_005194, partial [Gossypium laxum]|nr:hypothetical protein [Gossypium laxum]
YDKHFPKILINVNQNEPSWWVWVTDEMVPINVEEWSGIDDEKYTVITCKHHISIQMVRL